MTDKQDDEDGQVSENGEDCDDPGEAAQEGEAQQVLAGVEGVWLWGARDKGAVEAVEVWILKVDVINKTHAIISGLSVNTHI